MPISWQIILILLYSMANVLFSLSYGLRHPQSPLPAQAVYLTVGLLGIFVGGALSLQHKKILALEKRVEELKRNG